MPSFDLQSILHSVQTGVWVTITLLLCALVVGVFVLFIIDSLQTKHALRRNYPVIARFRYLFEHLGEFFRQYFFAQDREELPFNRAQRAWVYRAAKDVDRMACFGSTRDIQSLGSFFFASSFFPMVATAQEPRSVTVGPFCAHPYTTHRFFHISGMSYGALSRPALQALSRGAAMAGIWLNTGEGGLADAHTEGECDIVFQIGTAKYGVRTLDGQMDWDKLKNLSENPRIKMFEVKISQGAKPGKGGILPGHKVTEDIAKTRGIPVGQDSISPPRHQEIQSMSDLLDFIDRVRTCTGKPVGVKAVLGGGHWIEALCQEVQKRGPASAPDFFTVDGAEGGTGAAPMSLMDTMGLPLRESLPLLVKTLMRYDLRERIKVIASGKLINPPEVALAFGLGADFVVSARGFMFSLGCIQAMQCHKNTCPTGVTTHNPRLQKGLVPLQKAARVMHYAQAMHYDLLQLAHSCGVTDPRDLNPHHVRIVHAPGRSQSAYDYYHYKSLAADDYNK